MGIVSCIQLALTLALAVQRRRDVIRALREDGKVRLLLEQGISGDRGPGGLAPWQGVGQRPTTLPLT